MKTRELEAEGYWSLIDEICDCEVVPSHIKRAHLDGQRIGEQRVIELAVKEGSIRGSSIWHYVADWLEKELGE